MSTDNWRNKYGSFADLVRDDFEIKLEQFANTYGTDEFFDTLDKNLRKIYGETLSKTGMICAFDYMNTGTSGFNRAFVDTCKAYNGEDIIAYLDELTWYEYDFFMDKVVLLSPYIGDYTKD